MSRNSHAKITAIVGTYRKGGVVDSTVDELLRSASEAGAEVRKIYLLDQHIEFCTNCRTCTQQEGPTRGQCPIDDDVESILEEIERSDAIVLASPMNFWTVTAIMKRFIERLVRFAYWPWGRYAPKSRSKRWGKLAVVVGASAAPALVARMMTSMVGLLKSCAGLLGAKTIGVVFVGLASDEPKKDIGRHVRDKAQRLGRRLAAHRAARA